MRSAAFDRRFLQADGTDDETDEGEVRIMPPLHPSFSQCSISVCSPTIARAQLAIRLQIISAENSPIRDEELKARRDESAAAAVHRRVCRFEPKIALIFTIKLRRAPISTTRPTILRSERKASPSISSRFASSCTAKGARPPPKTRRRRRRQRRRWRQANKRRRRRERRRASNASPPPMRFAARWPAISAKHN